MSIEIIQQREPVDDYQRADGTWAIKWTTRIGRLSCLAGLTAAIAVASTIAPVNSLLLVSNGVARLESILPTWPALD